MREEGFDNDAHLDSTIKKLEIDVKKGRKKDTDGDEMEVILEPDILHEHRSPTSRLRPRVSLSWMYPTTR